MDIDSANQEIALRAASRIFSKCYSAAEGVEGAYQLTNEKIKTLYQGRRSRRSDFISTEAIIYVITKNQKLTLEEAKTRLNSKSEAEISEINRKMKTEFESHWELARKFDLADHGGQKFVRQSRAGSKIIFVFSDNRKLEFNLSACSKSMQKWLSLEGVPVESNEAIETPVIAEKILEITKWPSQLINQALAGLEQDELSILYANHSLSQFRRLLVQEERKINTPMNKIAAHDISDVIQSLLDELNK